MSFFERSAVSALPEPLMQFPAPEPMTGAERFNACVLALALSRIYSGTKFPVDPFDPSQWLTSSTSGA